MPAYFGLPEEPPPYEYVHSNFAVTGNMLHVFKKLAYIAL